VAVTAVADDSVLREIRRLTDSRAICELITRVVL